MRRARAERTADARGQVACNEELSRASHHQRQGVGRMNALEAVLAAVLGYVIAFAVFVGAARVSRYDWKKPSTYGTTRAGAPPPWQLLGAIVVLAAVVVLMAPARNVWLAVALGLAWIVGAVVILVATRSRLHTSGRPR